MNKILRKIFIIVVILVAIWAIIFGINCMKFSKGKTPIFMKKKELSDLYNMKSFVMTDKDGNEQSVTSEMYYGIGYEIHYNIDVYTNEVIKGYLYLFKNKVKESFFNTSEISKEAKKNYEDMLYNEEIIKKSDAQYIIIDSLMMFDDGGSYYLTYYEINLQNNLIEKKQNYCNKELSASYYEKVMTSYMGKVLETRQIDQDQHNKIESLLKKILENKFENNTNLFYIKLKTKDREARLSEQDMNEFLDIIK